MAPVEKGVYPLEDVILKCLVTGGAGFIGSHLVEKLLAEGHNVLVYDNLSTGQRQNLESVWSNRQLEFVQGDILDLDTLNPVIADCDEVYHLAAGRERYRNHSYKYPRKASNSDKLQGYYR